MVLNRNISLLNDVQLGYPSTLWDMSLLNGYESWIYLKVCERENQLVFLQQASSTLSNKILR